MANISPYEPAAKARVATAMAASFSFCSERKYLAEISRDDSFFKLRAVPSPAQLEAKWIAIKQVGRPLEKSAEHCFTAMQKILYSCFLPKEMQLLFLIVGTGSECKMYLGLRCKSESRFPNRKIKYSF